MVSLTVLTLAFEIVLIECVLGQMLGSLGLLEQASKLFDVPLF